MSDLVRSVCGNKTAEPLKAGTVEFFLALFHINQLTFWPASNLLHSD